jgi:hypothetical protein
MGQPPETVTRHYSGVMNAALHFCGPVNFIVKKLLMAGSTIPAIREKLIPLMHTF